MPKSVSFTSPSSRTMMLAGLMSRCTTRASWATPSASAAWPDDRADLARYQRPASVEDSGERLAGDELHDEEREALVLAVVEDRRDVGVQQRRRVHRLVAEAEGEEPLVVGVGAHDLDRDLAPQHEVGAGPDIGHPPGSDAALQLIAVAEDEPFLQAVHVSGTGAFRSEGARQLTSQGPSSAVMVRDPAMNEHSRAGALQKPSPGRTAPAYIPLASLPRTVDVVRFAPRARRHTMVVCRRAG